MKTLHVNGPSRTAHIKTCIYVYYCMWLHHLGSCDFHFFVTFISHFLVKVLVYWVFDVVVGVISEVEGDWAGAGLGDDEVILLQRLQRLRWMVRSEHGYRTQVALQHRKQWEGSREIERT